jgi:phosphatidylglycerophosphate synthase
LERPLNNRRPLQSRNTKLAKKITGILAARHITPNQISAASVAAALMAGAAFWAMSVSAHAVLTGALLLLAAVGCQLRLVCNLFDGLVAVEGGKGAPDGPFWNEFPDRIADIVIFAGLGLGLGSPALGFAAATMAVLTAYTRELGVSIGLPANFSGPMAKQHRMALITGAAVLAVFEPLFLSKGFLLTSALWTVCIGGLVTAIRRAIDIRRLLLNGAE